MSNVTEFKEFIQIAPIQMLMRFVLVLVLVFFAKKLVQRFKEELESKGWKGIIDETLIGLLLVGVFTYLMFFDGITVVLILIVEIAVYVIPLILDGLKSVLGVK